MDSTRSQTLPDGIAVITLDMRDRSPAGGLVALRSGIRDIVERNLPPSGTTSGMVIRLLAIDGIPSIDPAAILGGRAEEHLLAEAGGLARHLAQLEASPLRSVAIIEGAALG